MQLAQRKRALAEAKRVFVRTQQAVAEARKVWVVLLPYAIPTRN